MGELAIEVESHARVVSRAQGLDLWENARLFALLNMALADGYVAMVDAKNHQLWRPVTAIREGDIDGNQHGWRLELDLLRGTPEPGLPSGHSIEGGVGAAVLQRFFGTDRIALEDCSTSPARRAAARRGERADAVYEVLPAAERVLPDPHRLPLPQGGRGRDRLRTEDREAGREPAARPVD